MDRRGRVAVVAIATAGLLAGEPAVDVEAGPRFPGDGDPLAFLGNPFSGSSSDARSDFRIPSPAEPSDAGGIPP